MSKKTTPPEPAQEPAQDPVRQPLPEPEGGWPADEFTGMSGQFVRDPFTGVRSRAEAA